MTPSKAELRDAIVARLEEELAVLTAGAQSARAEATDGENRSEGKYDMRAQLAAYLAAGQGKLAAELHEAIAAYRALPLELSSGGAAAVGSVVRLRSGGETLVFFLGPARGGLELTVGGVAVTVITPGSPLGRELVNRRVGETLSGRREILSVD